MADLGISGLASGFDWRSVVDQLAEVERAPQTLLKRQQATLNSVNNAYSTAQTYLTSLQIKVDALNETSLFEGRKVDSSDTTVATATADGGTPLAKYTFAVSQLATASVQQGSADAGSALNATSDVSSLVLSSAPLATAVTAGTFTVNGKRVTVATSDTLQAVFDAISTATNGAVTGSYDPATDKISLTGSGAITLGSTTDTSNFLSALKLYNNGTSSVASSYALGTVKQTTALSAANFATAVSDGGGGNGSFKINGVAIAFNASTDSVTNVLTRINSSAAGVTASYDSVTDRFLLTNKNTGDLGIALEDVTGNFLAASKLAPGSLARGNNLTFTVNGGGTLVSSSNTISSASSGITGLAVTVLKAGSASLEVQSDKTKVKAAITDFIAAYNQVQSFIDTATASTTDAKGKVSAGVLAGQTDANDLATKLRRLANSPVTGLTTTLTKLADLGITTRSDNNQITLAASTTLDAALADKAGDVKELFTNSSTGLAVQLSAYLKATVGASGSLINRQSTLTKQAKDIDTQVADLERLVQSNRAALIRNFVAMESAQQRSNQQLQFLKQRFGG
ncbi:MAG: flagellar hook-associated protein 2 [Limisphaerales bacterium]|nr:MAG: flagellar hook-associated protein 2 [Limisphaerales bacterium]KAG0506959.1 MAG: flagellar hook-associated protein 2 [Limisphaerales bacterium]TXT49191.1 MAG: flagellar hook-associated protein 2 [Limisphaerales bacterium]